MGLRERRARKRMEATLNWDTPTTTSYGGHEIEVSNFWFRDENEQLWTEQLLPLLPQHGRYLEIGVCEGASMTWILTHTQMSAIGVDPYVDFKEQGKQQVYDTYWERARRNLLPWLSERCLLCKTDSQTWLCREIARCTPPEGQIADTYRFDFAYIDGDHRPGPAIVDMLLAWKMLKPGGLMLIDDAARRWNRGQPGTNEASYGFQAIMEDRYFVEWADPSNVRSPRQICFRKRKDRGWL